MDVCVVIRCLQSDENKQQDRALNRELNQERRADGAIKKLLFLGSGGSGKSTLFKQLRSLHGSGFGDKDRLQFRDHIYAQIIANGGDKVLATAYAESLYFPRKNEVCDE